ncbi:MAG TPA: zf-HC2 domain-containing protein [Gemmatimonadaceae bacterium]|nr:zf-HC2 domain-containing protein [Gemmatimonadaceae bacterium]
MQHPDEGTIHAWLDGALGADEAAQIDAHVNGCAECAAAVAEARGFIAASSRILTALDNAPRGVIPAAAPVRKRFDPMVWRIAASVLVIAGGTLIVVRNQGTRETSMTASTSTVNISDSAAAFKAAGESAPTVTAPAPAVPLSVPTVAPSRRAAQPSAGGAAVEKPNGSIGNRGDFATTGAPAIQNTAQMAEKSVAKNTGVAADRVAAVPAPAPTSRFLPSAGAIAGAGVIAGELAEPTQPLKVVESPRRIGANVTVYEIGGDTVTLTESRAVALSSIAATDAAAATTQSESRGKAAATRNGVSNQTVPASAPTVAPPPPAAPAPVRDAARPEDPNVVHTITWTDPATRSTLSLSGRMSEARLQLIRLRIEKERAQKKTP